MTEIQKFYNKLAEFNRKCPKCEATLVCEEPGCWYCDECPYGEENNITECQGECIENKPLLLSVKGNFGPLEENYCDILDFEGCSCLALAQGEADQADFEFYEMEKALERHGGYCGDPQCWCNQI